MSRLARVLMVVALCAACGAGDLETMAQQAVAGRRWGEARRYYERLAERDPLNEDYLLWMGRLSGWMKEYERADRTFDQVLAQDPDNVEALVGKAYVAMWQERFDDGDALLAEAAAHAPDDVAVQLARARSYRHQGRLEHAANVVVELLEHAPHNREALELDRVVNRAPLPRGLVARMKAKLRRTICGHI
jgi:tetratricopeptide (TPR) repeat protein